jgi:hypothetical protein
VRRLRHAAPAPWLQVVVAPPELHWQSFREAAYDGSLSGEVRSPLHSIPALPLDERRIIAHRWVAGRGRGTGAPLLDRMAHPLCGWMHVCNAPGRLGAAQCSEADKKGLG